MKCYFSKSKELVGLSAVLPSGRSDSGMPISTAGKIVLTLQISPSFPLGENQNVGSFFLSGYTLSGEYTYLPAEFTTGDNYDLGDSYSCPLKVTSTIQYFRVPHPTTDTGLGYNGSGPLVPGWAMVHFQTEKESRWDIVFMKQIRNVMLAKAKTI